MKVAALFFIPGLAAALACAGELNGELADPEPAAAKPVANLVRDSGFEAQTRRAPLGGAYWGPHGPHMFSGTDIHLGAAAAGANNAWLWADGAAEVTGAIHQWIDVDPNTLYVVRARLRSSPNLENGRIAIRSEGQFDVLAGQAFEALDGKYHEITFSFDSGDRTRVLLEVGFVAFGPRERRRAEEQWLQIDELYVGNRPS